MAKPEENLKRAGRWEILGAWLHVWTPPRGTYIPPVPTRKILLGAVATAIVVAVAAVLIGRSAEEGDKREARDIAAARARSRARVAKEQKPRLKQLTAPVPSGASASELSDHRRQLLSKLETEITADAQARFRDGTLGVRPKFTACKPYVRPRVKNPPEPPLSAAIGKYECLATTVEVSPTQRTEGGHAGYPFWARVDFKGGRVVWCKINLRPAEGGIGHDVFVRLPAPCDLKLDGVVPKA
ncbi:MAG TPA: hypothetical protein VF517_12235 [Thermoleophilaceae bacterium]|jgi:hypothetical protein